MRDVQVFYDEAILRNLPMILLLLFDLRLLFFCLGHWTLTQPILLLNNYNHLPRGKVLEDIVKGEKQY